MNQELLEKNTEESTSLSKDPTSLSTESSSSTVAPSSPRTMNPLAPADLVNHEKNPLDKDEQILQSTTPDVQPGVLAQNALTATGGHDTTVQPATGFALDAPAAQSSSRVEFDPSSISKNFDDDATSTMTQLDGINNEVNRLSYYDGKSQLTSIVNKDKSHEPALEHIVDIPLKDWGKELNINIKIIRGQDVVTNSDDQSVKGCVTATSRLADEEMIASDKWSRKISDLEVMVEKLKGELQEIHEADRVKVDKEEWDREVKKMEGHIKKLKEDFKEIHESDMMKVDKEEWDRKLKELVGDMRKLKAELETNTAAATGTKEVLNLIQRANTIIYHMLVGVPIFVLLYTVIQQLSLDCKHFKFNIGVLVASCLCVSPFLWISIWRMLDIDKDLQEIKVNLVGLLPVTEEGGGSKETKDGGSNLVADGEAVVFNETDVNGRPPDMSPSQRPLVSQSAPVNTTQPTRSGSTHALGPTPSDFTNAASVLQLHSALKSIRKFKRDYVVSAITISGFIIGYALALVIVFLVSCV